MQKFVRDVLSLVQLLIVIIKLVKDREAWIFPGFFNQKILEKMNPHTHAHGHTHGVIDPSILITKRGIWAVKWSFIALMATTIIQALVAYFSGSVALLGDTVHNLGDAFTAIPIGLAYPCDLRTICII